MKRDGGEVTWSPSRVAPHAGAWIETLTYLRYPLPITVAPHAGAWIETINSPVARLVCQRRPPRGGVD
ncbi:hypothetical protein MTBSS4_170023 [Magnetospirillum sp. SS-4]|nr:hypothetical protein MTBSS4_170023 [Magnetospirillum sp. SS-4]